MKGFSTLALSSALYLLEFGWDEPAQHRQRPDMNYPAFENPKKRELVSVEPFPDPAATRLLEKAGTRRFVQFVDKYSYEYQPEGLFDIIFLDGDHTYEGIKRDHAHLSPSLRPGGYLILHDYYGWYTDRNDRNKNGSHIRKVIKSLSSIFIKSDPLLVFLARPRVGPRGSL